jgi:hypothetical protein
VAGIRIKVFETAIHAMFQPGGIVYEEARESAKLDAPSRTGELAASIRVSSERRATRKMVGFQVRADAPYAYWVHEGVDHPIHPQGLFMIVPRFPEYGPRGPRTLDNPLMEKRYEVEGQPSQPFLRQNLEYVMSRVT